MADGSPAPVADSIESRQSWIVATAAFLIIMIGFGAPYIVVVGLKPIAADLGGARSAPSLAAALAYIGTATGGMLMGWWADRVGAVWTVLLGAAMVGLGTMVASIGTEWSLYLGYGLMIGLIGNAGIFAPLLTSTTRWFDRRRGVALSIVTSGQQISGTLWPPIFRYAIDTMDWRRTMLLYGAFVLATAVPLAWFIRKSPPAPAPGSASFDAAPNTPVLRMPPNLAFGLICVAVIGCCIAMAMPMGHLVAYCSDLGYDPARGAEMLSVLLGAAFLGRMFWGHMADRIGGLRTVLVGTFCQAIGMMLFLAIQDLVGMYFVAAAFGLGFGGIIPSYVLAVRELFPVAEAGWRIAAFLFFGLGAMALGGWLAGAIFDYAAYYQPAFQLGLATNLATVALVAFLVLRDRGSASAGRELRPVAA